MNTMKKNTTKGLDAVLTITVLALLFSLMSCSHHDNPTPVQVATQQLSVSWKVQSVTKDGVDISAQFANMTLTFTASSFTSTNGTPVWPVSGSWKFDDDTAKTITRSDSVEVTVTTISDNSLTLELAWDENVYKGGRTSSISKPYVFTFSKA